MSKYRPQGTNISFKNIDHFSPVYWVYHLYVEFALRYVFYNKFEVVNIENIPPKDTPLLIVSNHQNGLNDALCILSMFPDRRQPVFVARSDIFKKPLMARLLKMIKILPAFRPRDGEDPRQNGEIFQVSANVLKNHHTLVLFPESAHNAGNWLSYFRKGFARVAFQAEEESNYQLDVQVMPMGLYYSSYFNMREDVALVMGQPIPLASYLPLYKENPEKAQLALARDMHQKVDELVLNIGNDEDYPHYNLARLLYEPRQLERMNLSPRKFYNSLLAGREVVKSLKALKESNEAQLQSILGLAGSIGNALQQLNYRPWLLGTAVTLPWLLVRSALLLLMAPLYMALWLLNILPYSSPKLINRNVKDRMLHGSFAFGLGAVVAFPLFYLAYAITIGIVFQNFWYALFSIPLLVAGLLVFFYYRKGLVKIRAAWRYYLQGNRKDKHLLQLQSDYDQLMREMDVVMHKN